MPFQSEKQRRYLHANHPEIAKRWERDYAGGGRIGFDEGSNGITLGSNKYNITLEPGASGSWTSQDLGHGYNVDEKNITYGADTTANIGPLEIGMDYKKFLDKHDVTKDGRTVEKDTNRDRDIAYHLGIDLDTLYAKIDSDRDFKNFYLTLRYEFKGGGTPAHEAGIYGLAEGGVTDIGFSKVKPSNDGSRPGYFTAQYGGGDKSTSSQDNSPGHPANQPSFSPPDTQAPDIGGFNLGTDYEEDVALTMEKLGIKPDHAPDYGRGWVNPEDDYGSGDYMGPKDKVRIQNDILTRKQTWDKKKWQRDVKTGVSGFSAITNPFSFGKFIYEQSKKKKERIAEIDEDLDMLNKIGATKFSQHTDTIYQQLEQEKLDLLQPKKQPDLPTGGDGITGVASITYDDIEDKNKKERASLRWVKEQEKVDRSKQDAYYNMFRKTYMSAKGGRVPSGYNTGGLSNLFRLKNV